ncbi:MAG: AMMECR1 domain-containing protein [Myxococcales bacterium]|nr:MAG: AMMECR1 domain-containing protein [Myxococcales bacterium]
MKRNLAIVVFVLLALGAFACSKEEAKPAKNGKPKPAKVAVAEKPELKLQLSEADKQVLIGVARKTFELFIVEGKTYKPDDVPANLREMKSNRVFATLYIEGEWRGCVSAEGDTLIEATVQSVINTCRDKRFKSPTPEEVGRFRVELSYLQPMEEIATKDPAQIEKELEPGVDGIQVVHSSGKRAFFLPYVFVKKQRTTAEWLERLSAKAGLPKDAWKSPETRIYRYGTINFIEETPKGRSVDLYRYKVELDDVPDGALDAAVAAALDWLKAQKDATAGRFRGGFDEDHKPLPPAAPKAHLAGLIGLGEAAEIAKDLNLANDVRWGWDGLKDAVRTEGGALEFVENGAADLEGALLLADLLGASGAVKGRREMLGPIAASLAKLAGKDRPKPGKGAVIEDLPNYAVFVAARLVRHTKDEKLKALVKDLVARWWTAGGGWSAAAAIEAAKALDDEALADRSLAEAKALVAAQYGKADAPYADYIGAFKSDGAPRTIDVAVRLRGLAFVYEAMGERDPEAKAAIGRALVFGLRWLLEQQFTDASAFYIENYKTLVGAFKADILVNTARVEDLGAGLAALVDVRRALGEAWPGLVAAHRAELVK